ncbi:hypothetical protein JCM8547_006537 [Rhodosporidiobolus lusitaniae]
MLAPLFSTLAAAAALAPRAMAASNDSTIPGIYSSATVDFLRALPKVEHHIHIEGALSPELLFKLARRNNVTLDSGNFSSPDAVRERYRNFANLANFVTVSEAEMAVFLVEEDYEDLAYSYLERSSYDGLAHAEVNFLPEGHTMRGVGLETVVRGLKKGLKRGEQDFKITSELFACFSKSHNHTATMETIDDLARFVPSGDIIGLGAAGNEDGFPPSEFKEVYGHAASIGFNPSHFTIHAGETGPPSYVREAAFSLDLPRIDHAVQAGLQDPELVREMAERGKFVTLCPTSNVALKVYETVGDAPLKTFLDAGLKFSLGTDDPTFFGSFILDVYLQVHRAFLLSKETWIQIVRNSIDGTWTTEERKEELRKRLEEVVEEWEGRDI